MMGILFIFPISLISLKFIKFLNIKGFSIAWVNFPNYAKIIVRF